MNEVLSQERSHLFFLCLHCRGELKRGALPTFACMQCATRYEVKEETLIMVALETLPDHLRSQVEYFEHESISDTRYKLLPWQQSYLDRFVETFPELTNKVVVDCGTGSGYMAIELAKKGATVIACDLTLKSLLRLRIAAKEEGVGDRILTLCCSAEKIPLKDAVADYFISNAVLEHLPDEPSALLEIERICKPEAGVMITVPLAYRYLNPLLLPINFIHDKRIGHLRRYDENSLVQKLPAFRRTRTYYTGHFAKVCMTLCNMVMRTFNERYIENMDRKNTDRKWGASNIICFFERGTR